MSRAARPWRSSFDASWRGEPESLGESAAHRLGRPPQEVLLVAFGERALVHVQRFADGLHGTGDVLLAVRVAHDKRMGDDATPDQFLHEQGAERLTWLAVRVA